MSLPAVTHAAAGRQVILGGPPTCFFWHNMIQRNFIKMFAAYITARAPFFYYAFSKFMFCFLFCPQFRFINVVFHLIQEVNRN